jgi:hypothetical protein
LSVEGHLGCFHSLVIEISQFTEKQYMPTQFRKLNELQLNA